MFGTCQRSSGCHLPKRLYRTLDPAQSQVLSKHAGPGTIQKTSKNTHRDTYRVIDLSEMWWICRIHICTIYAWYMPIYRAVYIQHCMRLVQSAVKMHVVPQTPVNQTRVHSNTHSFPTRDQQRRPGPLKHTYDCSTKVRHSNPNGHFLLLKGPFIL